MRNQRASKARYPGNWLWRDQGRTEAARQLLVPSYDRFAEGFGTADLRAAKLLIGALR